MRTIPAPLQFEQSVIDFAVHPSQDIVVTGLYSGHVVCHRYGEESHTLQWQKRLFKKTCRGVTFTPDGSNLYGISKDKSIQTIDMGTGRSIRCQTETHEHALNAVLCLNEQLYATGDEEGVIKLWDARKEKPVFTYSEHEDFIADMVYSAEHKTLVVAGGDGYLSTWDIRKPDVAAMSDNIEDELLSLALIKNGRKVVAGTQGGILTLWTWGDWGDYKDRMVGHPSSIDAICKLDEDTICTGSGDGIIRLATLLPNEFHGLLGEPQDVPIDHLHLSHNKKYLLSSACDEEVIHFWDVAHLFEADGQSGDADTDAKDHGNDDAEEDSDSDEPTPKKKKKKGETKRKRNEIARPTKKTANSASFFSDL